MSDRYYDMNCKRCGERYPESSPEFCPNCDAKLFPHDERAYRAHLAREGSNPWNDHPDGCYFCGGDHHSDCCPDPYTY